MQILDSVRQAANVFYNYSGSVKKCFNISVAQPDTLADEGGWCAIVVA